MNFACATLVLSLVSQQCLSTSIDLWASLQGRAVPHIEPIDPGELKARLGTTPAEYNSSERHPGMVYFCREENWGPPCFFYYPELKYTCTGLSPELSGHVGSIFVEPGVICRLSGQISSNRCIPNKFFAWPEIQGGWSNLFHQEVPGGKGILGYTTKYFTCAKCTACTRSLPV
ncbi:hypothetical protein BGZ61DRAFT_370424 [Ilyonectria robusta]|uniref:uncharacterized protein n=1 Tax=Ilyonectria robusta TaxID=1079257 RepID=UPI001E8E1DA0|nr:uncharacterized protein BGZ61DRAFT_370424 [Ilyonectria robusta]KAH8659431.1 hypothetical protein BGZ61DRAFT_370424 [Ilyonectria robusta]